MKAFAVAAFASGLLAVGLLTGCSIEVDDPSDALTRHSDTLGAWNFTFWPRVNNTYPISICFKQTTVGTPTPNWSGDKTRVQNALTQTWDASSAVVLQFQGDCPGTIQSAWMPVELVYYSASPNAFGGWGAPGMDARLDTGKCSNCQAVFGYGSNYFEFETAAVHEVGHALGFMHERSRSDFTGCTSLEDGSFVAPEPESGPRLTLNLGAALPGEPWDAYSVMANWECYVNRVHDSITYYELSEGDKVGSGILYPPSLQRTTGSIRGTNGFITNNGALVRADGSIVPDWTGAGAHPEVYGATPPAWSVRLVSTGQYVGVGSGVQLPVSAFASLNYDAVRFQDTDAWNRSNTGTHNVVISSALHAAITKGVLSPLW